MKFLIFNLERFAFGYKEKSIELQPQFSNKKEGFTLVEIIVAVGILAILSVVGWAVFNNLQPSLKLAAVTRDIASSLRYAQQLAVTEQINHGLKFATTTNQYLLYRLATTTEELSRKNLPSGIVFCQIVGLTDGYATFNPYGAVLIAGSVCLNNEKGQSKVIEIKPSGFVKIQQ